MIVKNFELNKINLEKYNLFLFYGENEGHKNEVINNIFNKLNNYKKIKYDENDIFENYQNFIKSQSLNTESKSIRRWASSFMDENKCDKCDGSRLKNEVKIVEVEHSKDFLYTVTSEARTIKEQNKKLVVVACDDFNIEAEELIDSALKKYPKNTLLKYSKGRMLIKKGDFKEGWNFFEYRKSKLNEQYSNISEWKGEIITSKKILVYNEQGIGDAIQFSKYLFALSKKCKIIDFVLDDKLYPIFKNG